MQQRKTTEKFSVTITGAFLSITLIIIVSRTLGFFREILFANYFGTSNAFDIYLIGAVIPITINTIVLYLGQNYFIPRYNFIKSLGENPDDKFFKSIFLVFQISGLIGALVLYLLSNSIIAFYFKSGNSSSSLQALNIFRIFLVTIPFNCGISILIANNQAKYDYVYPAISRLFLNLLIIPVLVVFQNKLGVYTIPIGFVISIFIQFLFMIVKSQTEVSYSFFRHSHIYSNYKFIGLSIISILLIETIGQVYMITDRFFYSAVEPGGISALNYAMNIYLLPVSIFTIGFVTVIFPRFSEDYHSSSFKNLNQKFSDSMKVLMILFVPLSFLFFFFGDVIIKIIYERGNFGTSDTTMTFNILKLYSISLLFYSAYAIINKLIYSANLINSLLIITVSGILLKITLNAMFVVDLKQNGLALSTSVSFIFFFVSGLVLIHKKLPLDKIYNLIKDIIFHLLNGAISIGLILILFKTTASQEKIFELLKILVFLIIYFTNTKLLNHESFDLMKKIFHNIQMGIRTKINRD